MIVNKILDELFSSRSNIAVMRSLKNSVSGNTGRELARLSGISPKRCLEVLTSLEDMNLVTRIRGGRDHIFSLNREHFLVNKIILPLLEDEEIYRKQIMKDIASKLKKDSIAVYLFGSVARKEESINSDYDICIVYNNETAKRKLESLVNELTTSLNKKYGITLSPLYFSEQDFLMRAQKAQPPVDAILREGILIIGTLINKVRIGKTIKKSKHRPVSIR